MKTLSQYGMGLGMALSAAVLLASAVTLTARSEEAPSDWPRRAAAEQTRVSLYEPQVEAYTDGTMTGRAALSVREGDGEPVFGAIWFEMKLDVDRDQRTAAVAQFSSTAVRLPDEASAPPELVQRLAAQSMTGATLSLDPLLRSLDRENAVAQAAAAGRDAVPDILWTPYPVALVLLDGAPELRPVPDRDVMRAINTDSFLVMHKGTGQWYLRVGEEWMAAPAHDGPWVDAKDVPDSVAQTAADAGLVQESLLGKPRIVVATRPTEVIVTQGDPTYSVIAGTTLLYVSNTDRDVFLEIGTQKHYVLLAGRWFVTGTLGSKKWNSVPADQLPPTFKAIPSDSPKAGVLAHVPGTAPAAEAVKEAQSPVVQAVPREPAEITVTYDGEPEFVRTGSGQVYYATNTSYSVLRAGSLYYLCIDGVWYEGTSAYGPWTVCASVPTAIYDIPPNSPVYPVTAVCVYDYTPSYVYVGYTLGYYGWYPGWGGASLVYGFAPYYRPWHYAHRSLLGWPFGFWRTSYRSCWPRYGYNSWDSGRWSHHAGFRSYRERGARPPVLCPPSPCFTGGGRRHGALQAGLSSPRFGNRSPGGPGGPPAVGPYPRPRNDDRGGIDRGPRERRPDRDRIGPRPDNPGPRVGIPERDGVRPDRGERRQPGVPTLPDARRRRGPLGDSGPAIPESPDMRGRRGRDGGNERGPAIPESPDVRGRPDRGDDRHRAVPIQPGLGRRPEERGGPIRVTPAPFPRRGRSESPPALPEARPRPSAPPARDLSTPETRTRRPENRPPRIEPRAPAPPVAAPRVYREAPAVRRRAGPATAAVVAAHALRTRVATDAPAADDVPARTLGARDAGLPAAVLAAPAADGVTRRLERKAPGLSGPFGRRRALVSRPALSARP